MLDFGVTYVLNKHRNPDIDEFYPELTNKQSCLMLRIQATDENFILIWNYLINETKTFSKIYNFRVKCEILFPFCKIDKN